MKTYHWQGRNQQNQLVQGTEQAPDRLTLSVQLKTRHIVPLKITRDWRINPLLWRKFQTKKIPHKVLARFNFQLANLVAAGMPLSTSLTLLGQTTTHRQLQVVIETLVGQLEQGLSFAQALANQQHSFNPFYTALIHAGEHAGKLDALLFQIATTDEKIVTIKRKIIKALTYPLSVIVIAMIICIGLLVFVIPRFAQLFNSFGAQLPWVTRGVLAVADILKTHGLNIIMGCGLVGFMLRCTLMRARRAKTFLKDCLLHCPFIGNCLHKGNLAHFTRLLAITLQAQLPLIPALELIKPTLKYPCYQNSIDDMINGLNNGQSLYHSMAQTNLYPRPLLEMIRIGEESGHLVTLCAKIADEMAAEVDQVVGHLTQLLEPLVMVMLAGLLGSMMLAMYLPIFRLGGVVA